MAAMVVSATGASGQISDGAGRFSQATAFLTVGGENTQFPYYADNAIGFDAGFSYQPRKLLGFEARMGAYPYSARFLQVPMTAGLRIGSDSMFGFPYSPFAYFGAGVSRSQEEPLGGIGTTPVFSRCWQADVGFDRPYATFSWRMVQVSWRETYGQQQTLRSLGLSTGLTYRLRH